MNNIKMYFYTYIEERIIFIYLSVWSCDKVKDKQVKAIPLQTWTGPEVSWRLRLPDFKTIGT
jgi:hypothetical protein